MRVFVVFVLSNFNNEVSTKFYQIEKARLVGGKTGTILLGVSSRRLKRILKFQTYS